jgi:hypothetical protein
MAKAYLEKLGFYASLGETEYNGRQHDLFGFADLIAFEKPQTPRSTGRPRGTFLRPVSPTPASAPILIQVTTQAQMLARMLKISKSNAARDWHNTYGQIYVFGYPSVATTPSFILEEANICVNGAHWMPVVLPAGLSRTGAPVPTVYVLTSYEA